MNPVPRKIDPESQKLIDEWLKTNKPQECEPYKRSENVEYTTGFYGTKKKSKKD
jgi:hypothetical protein